MAERNLSDIIKVVRRFNVRRSLARVNRVAVEAHRQQSRVLRHTWVETVGGYKDTKQAVVPTNQLVTLTKIILAHHYTSAVQGPTRQDIIHLANEILDLPIPFTSVPDTPTSLDEFMFQTTFQQLPLQRRDEAHMLGRMLVMFRDVPKEMRDAGEKLPFNLESEFKVFTGLTIDQFIWTGMSIFSACMSRAYVNMAWGSYEAELQSKWKGHIEDAPTQVTLWAFLRHTSKDTATFKKEIGDLRKTDQQHVAYDFQPLLSYPIVQVSASQLVVPVPKLLLDRITSGIFHDFTAHLDQSIGNPKAPFRAFFGKLFEKFVEKQLKLVFSQDILIPETSYTVGKEQRSTPDWTVNSPDGIVVIECRTSTFGLNTKKTGETQRIRMDLTRIGVKTLQSLDQKVNDIAAGLTPIEPASTKPIKRVLCTWEYMETRGLFGSLLRNELKSRIEKEPADFQLVPLLDLERICACRDSELFYRGLNVLTVNETFKIPHDGGPQRRLDDVLGERRSENPVTQKAYHDFMSAISSGA